METGADGIVGKLQVRLVEEGTRRPVAGADIQITYEIPQSNISFKQYYYLPLFACKPRAALVSLTAQTTAFLAFINSRPSK